MNEPRYREVFKVTPDAVLGFFEDYRFLSNFHQCDIWYMGMLYPSTENAYQASKYPESMWEMFTDCTPAEAKKLTHQFPLNPEDMTVFDSIKMDIMAKLLIEKFSIPDLKHKLLATGEKYLEETNYWNDVFWGVCNGVGLNVLGRLLMETRRYYQRLDLMNSTNRKIKFPPVGGNQGLTNTE